MSPSLKWACSVMAWCVVENEPLGSLLRYCFTKFRAFLWNMSLTKESFTKSLSLEIKTCHRKHVTRQEPCCWQSKGVQGEAGRHWEKGAIGGKGEPGNVKSLKGWPGEPGTQGQQGPQGTEELLKQQGYHKQMFEWKLESHIFRGSVPK